MKNLSRISLVAISSSLIITGCGSNPEKDRADVKEAFISYQTASAEYSQGPMYDDLQNLFKEIDESLNEEDRKTFQSGFESTSAKYDALSPEGQKITADLYQEMTPANEYINFDGMSDAERATVGAMTIMVTSAVQDDDVTGAKSVTDEDVTLVDSRHATIDYEDPGEAETRTSRTVFLVKDGKEWKIDGAKTYEDYVKPESE